MRKPINLLLFGVCLLLASCQQSDQSASNEVDLIYTTDVHGKFLPYDFLRQRPDTIGLANIYSFVDQTREKNPNGTLLIDGGDLTEGTPAMYYYNYEAKREPHLASRMANFMQYDVLCVGNHDLEGGESVYRDHLMREFQMPWLAANALNNKTDDPFFQPYCVLERKGYRIAVLGLISTETDNWMSQTALPNIRFISMKESAEQWIPIIEERENPDMIIGLFHAGHEEVDYVNAAGDTVKDGALRVIKEVRGFDVALIAHDHLQEDSIFVNNFGDSVCVLQPLPHAEEFASLKILFGKERKANNHLKASYSPKLTQTSKYPSSQKYLDQVIGFKERVDQFLDRPVGNINEKLDAGASLVGPSSLINLIHEVQFFITGADISFVSCLSNFNDILPGALTMRQLFSIYKYENQVHKMWMYGYEVKQFLEYGYGRQFNQMKSDKDHLLAFKYDANGEIQMGRFGPELVTPQYNYTQAAGLYYLVDVTKPVGERVNITTMADGRIFDPNQKYFVALSSHQASGGGGFLPYGLGWDSDECVYHTVTESVKDMRSYISEFVYRADIGKKQSLGTWRVQPYEWWQKASRRDVELLLPYLIR